VGPFQEGQQGEEAGQEGRHPVLVHVGKVLRGK
jgi:hypothetical protein